MGSFSLVSVGLLLILSYVVAFVPSKFGSSLSKYNPDSSALFAHHPQKKIVKKKMDRRPIKHRLSDINRKNVNLNKCIEKVEGAPPDYAIISAEEYLKIRDKMLNFWEEGDPEAEWHEITEEDKMLVLPQNREPLPVGGVQKRPPLVKSGTA